MEESPAAAPAAAPSPAAKRQRRLSAGDVHPAALPDASLFTRVPLKPRLMLLTYTKSGPVNPGRASAALGGASSVANSGESGTGAAVEADVPPLVRPPYSGSLDEYLYWVGRTFYPGSAGGATSSQWALLRRTTLGQLTSPAREPRVFDKWAPLEVAKFEAAICIAGKHFPVIARIIGTKTAGEVIEFYYAWKTSKNYAVWKSAYKNLADNGEEAEGEEEEDEEDGDGDGAAGGNGT